MSPPTIITSFGPDRSLSLPFPQFCVWRAQVNAWPAIGILLMPETVDNANQEQTHEVVELKHKEKQFEFLPASMQPLGSDALECPICFDFVHLADGAVQHIHVITSNAGARPSTENGWRSECGRIMCAVCVSKLRARGGQSAKCPCCRAELDANKAWKFTQLTPVPLHTRLALKQLAVQCKLCKHLEIAGNFEKHLKTCSHRHQPA